MVQTLRASEIGLAELREQFGLQRSQAKDFFQEWQKDLLPLTDIEKAMVDRVKEGFLNLLEAPPLLEDAVRLSVIAPLLFLADFYLPPARIRTEVSVDITTIDNNTTIEGRIDILVLKQKLWIAAIESKRAAYSVEAGLAQTLSYMLASPQMNTPVYGAIVTGGSFLFLKLQHFAYPQYAHSNLFSLFNEGNDLYSVLAILKRIRQIALLL